MYRGSSYINWLFIPECRCLSAPSPSPVGVLLQSVSDCLSNHSKNLTVYLNSMSCPLSQLLWLEQGSACSSFPSEERREMWRRGSSGVTGTSAAGT